MIGPARGVPFQPIKRACNWLIDGALLYLTEGLKVPKAISEATDEYREEMDPVRAFNQACVTIHPKDDHEPPLTSARKICMTVMCRGASRTAPHPDAEIIGSAVRSLDKSTRLTEDDCEWLLGSYAVLDRDTIRAVAGAPFSMSALVIRCAVLGEAMPWDIGEPRPRRQYVRYEDAMGRARRRPLVYGAQAAMADSSS
jgi:hypothetical protein